MRWLPNGTSSSVMPSAILSKEAFMTVHHGPAVGSGNRELPVDFQFLGNHRCEYFRPGTMPTQSSRGFPTAGSTGVPGAVSHRLRKSIPATNSGRFRSQEFVPVLQIRIRSSRPSEPRVVSEATLTTRRISPGLYIRREHRLPETRA